MGRYVSLIETIAEARIDGKQWCDTRAIHIETSSGCAEGNAKRRELCGATADQGRNAARDAT
jgi:hypothetical protein